MVLKLGLPFIKLTSKLKNHHRHYCHQSDAFSASLQSFWSDVSAALKQATSNSTPGVLESRRSLEWIGQCLEQLLTINTSFAKLVVDIDFPVSEWGAASVEEYLTHTLNLLDFLNSISSSLSCVGQSRLALSHALSLLGNSPSPSPMIQRLRPIKLKSENCSRNRKGCMKKAKKQCKQKHELGKEEIVHEALVGMRIAGFLVCGIVFSNLSGDGKPYFELVKSADSFSDSSFIGSDWSILCSEMSDNEEEGGVIMREVKEVNNAVACLVAAIDAGKSGTGAAAEELHRRLDVLQDRVESIGREVDRLFSVVLAGRNELLQSLGQRKKQ